MSKLFSARSTLVALGLLSSSVVSGAADAPAAHHPYAPSGGAAALAEYLSGRTEVGAPRALRPAGVSAPFAATPGADIRINAALDAPERTTQSETTLAASGSTVCAGYNDSGGGGISAIARSTDGGQTWMHQGGVGPNHFGDQVLAVHRATGTFYDADLTVVDGKSAIGVSTSTNQCQSFQETGRVSHSLQAGDLQDKPWMTVDNSGGPRDGSLYVCWTRFVNYFYGTPSAAQIRFARSTDGGQSFINDQVISTAPDFYGFGCHVNVGPAGEVYVAWSNYFGDAIRFRRSVDGGDTWDLPVQVNAMPFRVPGTDRIVPCGQFNRPTLNGNIRMVAQVWMAVDTTGGPFTGNIYVVWAGDPPGATDNSDVFFTYSIDGGSTWQPEVQISGDTTTDQFEPFVEVGGYGTVAVMWYDRRNDPVSNFNIDVYTTYSTDGGSTLGPLARVTDVSFGVPPISGQPTATGNFDPVVDPCYMGEYIAVAPLATDFAYAWGDNRNLVVSAAYPGGRPDPDVFFDRLPIPPLRCGNGVVDTGEQCDDGDNRNGDGCDANCTPTGCGNGVVTAGEQCDDGNVADGDGCDSDCTISCGNGRVTPGEQCDDGNTVDGDGCDSNCAVTGCGNGVVSTGEQCDDANTSAGDACPADCRYSGALIRGSRRRPARDARGCAVEWYVANPDNARDRYVLPSANQVCTDGDPGCDQDTQPGRCRFAVVVCVNNADPNLPACTPAGLSALEVLAPRLRLREIPLVQQLAEANVVKVRNALQHLLDPNDVAAGHTHAAPLTANQQNLCSEPIDLDVLSGPRAHDSVLAAQTLVVRSTGLPAPRRHQRSRLRLTCGARPLP